MSFPLFLRTVPPTVNPKKLYVQHFSLTPQPPGDVVTIPGTGTSGPLVFQGPQEGVFEGFQIMLTATAPGSLLLTKMDHRITRSLISGFIHADSIFGIPIMPGAGAGLGVFPYYLPETLWLRRTETLAIQFQNLSGQNNIVRCVMHGRLYVQQLADSLAANSDAIQKAEILNLTTAPFFFTTSSQPLADGVAAHGISALATVKTTINIANDGAFELGKISGSSTGAFTLKIYDPNTGRVLTNQPIHSDLIVGSSAFPYILPEPLFMKRSGYLNLEITDLSGNVNDIYLTLAGRRIYSGDQSLP